MLKVIVIGLGPIGINSAHAVLGDSGMNLVGLVDIDPAKAGKTLGDISKLPAGLPKGPAISGSIADATKAGCDVAIVTTTSRFDSIVPTLKDLIARKIHVVSSCEEMLWPELNYAKLGKEIDELAAKAGVALLGTGVNPGFVMDLLPVVLSSMVAKVSAVKVTRKVDASTRRLPLQTKVGATMTVEHFNDLKKQGKIGHMGLPESVAMLASGLGRKASAKEIRIELDALVADKPIPSALGTIEKGKVRGIYNHGYWKGDGLSIELHLTMALGVTDPHDTVELDGPVKLSLTIPGGTPGDTATVSAMLNCARLLPKCKPGLRTMIDVPPAGAHCK